MRLASKQQDDHQLIERVQEGDQMAFRLLVNKHQRKVRNLVYLTVGKQYAHWVDDIAQEVFIKVYQNLNQFDGRAKFTTWLYRITVNHCTDELRKKKVKRFFKWYEPEASQMNIEDKLEQSETAALVRQAIGALPVKFRLPLILKDIEGYEYQEVAQMLDCKMGTVKSRLYRGRKLLKEELEPLKGEFDV